jgi:O-antigen ligase
MADNGSTWLKAGIPGAKPGMEPGFIQSNRAQPSTVQAYPAVAPRDSRMRTMMIVAALAVGTVFILMATPADWTWELLRVMGVGIILMSAFYFPLDHPRPAFVIWWVMLISECIFFREGDAYAANEAYAGRFPTAAYGEVIGWLLCLLAVLVCSSRIRGYIGKLFGGDYKWSILFALLSLGSCIYAPRPTFGLVWGFKLTLVVLILLCCSVEIQDFRSTVSFLQFTFWAFVIIILEPVIIAAFRGEMFDDEGRMSTVVSPNALSPNAGAVLLMALTLFSRRKGEGLHKSAVMVGMVACLIMILAGSKTGILAAIFAGGLYFLVCRKFGSAVGYIAATAVLIGVMAMMTPLGDYFHLYEQREGAESFSGRTLLWSAVLPRIKSKPVLGHGYLASEFISEQVNAVEWQAPHLHNGFLESLYNGGVIGFLVMMAILFVIPRNLYHVLRRAPPADPIYQLGAGCLALYAFLLINGVFNSSFGGKPSSPFVLLLGLVVVSHKLLQLAPGPAMAWKKMKTL